MAIPPVDRLRAICLAFPGATERLSHGEPTFFAGRSFAMHASADTHHGNGRPAVWIKSNAANQQLLIANNPDRYFFPPYVGAGGWVGVWLDRRPPWREIADVLEDGWRLVAPKKLLTR